jgi:hypothetical protein
LSSQRFISSSILSIPGRLPRANLSEIVGILEPHPFVGRDLRKRDSESEGGIGDDTPLAVDDLIHRRARLAENPGQIILRPPAVCEEGADSPACRGSRVHLYACMPYAHVCQGETLWGLFPTPAIVSR